MLADFKATYTPLVEEKIAEAIAEKTTAETLAKSMQYSIDAGGKRLRPILLLAVADAFGAEIDDSALDAAGALEMIHTYSLIHDDLPAMDNDDLRRGKPTNHKVFGDGMAVLAGDGLLTLAFEVTAEAFPYDAGFIAELAAASGTHGMVSGQVLDIEGEEKSLTLDELKEVHANKTGALIVYAVRCGVAIGVRDTYLPLETLLTVSDYLQQYAQSFGLAFQIRDDILDVTATTEELGKTAGKDVAMDKSTYPALLGLDGAKAALAEELDTALESLSKVSELITTFKSENLVEFILSLNL
jgi:geranylgeranyl diphosphate synthase type II